MTTPDGVGEANKPRSSAVTHAGVFLVAAGLFSFVAWAVGTKRARPVDERARNWIRGHRSDALDVAVKPVTLLSLPVLVVTATAAVAWWLKKQGRDRAAFAVAIAPVLAATAGESFTMFLPQQNPPDRGDISDTQVAEPSFPSGHVTGVVAEALTLGYVLSREDLGSPGLAAFVIAWPMVVAMARVYRNRHWASDAVGGLLAGTAVAALTTMFYDAGSTSRFQGDIAGQG